MYAVHAQSAFTGLQRNEVLKAARCSASGLFGEDWSEVLDVGLFAVD